MKKISKLISLMALSLLAVTSCDLFTIGDEYDNYVPAEKPAVAEVYFAQGLPTTYDLKGKTSFSVPVNRVNTASALTVNILSNAEKAFTVPSSVSFAAGEAVANIVVTYDEADLLPGGEYKFSFTLSDETSVYGDNSFSCKGTLPASFQKWKKGTLTLGYYAQEEVQDVYYQEVNPKLWYCYIENCFDTEKHDDFPEKAKPTKYYFYWDKETNALQVPMQAVDGAVDSDGCQLYFGDGEAFYKEVYLDDPTIFQRAGYKDAADYAYNAAGLAQPKYDGNGGFYLANCYFLSYEQSVAMFGESGYAWSVGDLQDLLVVEGFNRSTDYNALEYEGLWVADVDSKAFEQTWSDQVVKIYNKVIDKADSAKVVYYLPDYFDEGYGLAFVAHHPESLKVGEDEIIYPLDNPMSAGISVFGQELYYEIKGGKVIVVDGDYPSYQVNVHLYTMVDDKKTTDFGSFIETVTPYDIYKDWFTVDDLIPSYKEDYLGSLTMYAEDALDGGSYYWNIDIEDAGAEDGTEWLAFNGLLPIKSQYLPVNSFNVEWYNGYLYIDIAECAGPFVYNGSEYPVTMYPMSTKTGYYYKEGTHYLIGGFVYSEATDEYSIAFTNYPYNDDEVDGIFFNAEGFGGLAGYALLQAYWNEETASVSTTQPGWSVLKRAPKAAGSNKPGIAMPGKASFERIASPVPAKNSTKVARTLNISNAAPFNTANGKAKVNVELK